METNQVVKRYGPEPWREYDRDDQGDIYICDANGLAVAIVLEATFPHNAERTEANALLIAAAPRMYEALVVQEDAHALRNFVQTEWIAEVVAMVEKYPAVLNQTMTAEEAAVALFNHAVDLRTAAIAKARGEAS